MKRRQFLTRAIPAAVLPSVLDGFSMRVLGDSPLLAALMNAYNETDHVLVIIQLNGGNDGLNMLVPVDQYSNYYNARSNIAIPENAVLKLNGYPQTGLHPSMQGIQAMFNEGKVHFVHSVGYPNPNFSHFRSTDIWMSASDSDQVLTTGWAGRYLADQYVNFPTGYPNSSMPDPLGIQIGSMTSLAFQGPSASMGISISSATNFYNLINGVQDPVPPTHAGEALEYVRLVARQSNAYSARIVDAANKVPVQGAYPARNNLADQLKIIARLIKGGLKTRIYMASIGGFDTHALQTNTGDPLTGSHTVLLQRLSEAVKAFQDDLQGLGVADRVIGMTFSEFGRRIKSNASNGTDHGAAAPMMLFGKNIVSGITGNNPVLPATAGVNDNLPMQYDFRSIYASLLETWFCVDATALQTIMLRNYQSLSLCVNGNCRTTAVRPVNTSGTVYVSNYPNPFTSSTTVSFTTSGGHTLIQIMDAMGRVISTPVDRVYASGNYQIVFQSGSLPPGVYYVRFQNGILQQVKPMLKVR